MGVRPLFRTRLVLGDEVVHLWNPMRYVPMRWWYIPHWATAARTYPRSDGCKELIGSTFSQLGPAAPLMHPKRKCRGVANIFLTARLELKLHLFCVAKLCQVVRHRLPNRATCQQQHSPRSNGQTLSRTLLTDTPSLRTGNE